VFLALAIWLIIKAGSANTLSVFSLHYATVKGYSGFSGVIAGSIYTILAFIGFGPPRRWLRRRATRGAPSRSRW
jgi:amino acid transporter